MEKRGKTGRRSVYQPRVMCVSVFQMEKNNVEVLYPLGLVNGGENGRKGEESELRGK